MRVRAKLKSNREGAWVTLAKCCTPQQLVPIELDLLGCPRFQRRAFQADQRT